MTKQISNHAAAAKMIRQELKKHGIKGSVRASSASMTSSVHVNLENELPATVEAIGDFCNRFQYGHFDGMTDMYEYSNTSDDLPQVKFTFVHVSYSDEIRQSAWDFARNYYAGMEDAPESYKDAFNFRCEQMQMHGDMIISRILNEERGGFWAQYKPRMAA